MGKRTITLTGRAPVTINEAAWPIVAQAKSFDGEHEFQANRTWSIRVRQHADGRSIVYAVHDSQWQGEPTIRAGELLDADESVPNAIGRVGEYIGGSATLIDECVADLPAVVLE